MKLSIGKLSNWAFGLTAVAAVLMSEAALGIDTVTWVGGATADWNDANVWKNERTGVTGDAATIFGQTNGSDGMNNVDPTQTRARNIVIDGGSRVEYFRPTPNSDFRLKQGTSLTVKGGAVWVQETDETYPENAWTQMDLSNLILDGGTYRRSGESPAGDGGGLLMFGSYRDSDNQDRIGAPAKINVEIKNSGRLENTGQVWFGADDEHTAGTQATITINNGVMDLTGGTILQSNSTLEVDADLAFFYDYDETNAVPKNEQWAINFTGPGSLTVDSAGINVYRQDDQSVWTGGAPVSYQDLWNQGILKANGLSGGAVQPADFGTFFTVAGTPGSNDYKLTSINQGIDTVTWVGGATADWNDANVWKNERTGVTGDAATIFGQTNGSDGMNNVDPTQTRARNIVIDGGSRVEYFRPTPNSDFRLKQGTSLTVKGGAVWVQETDETYPENAWTQMDLSNLILDGGTYRRSGESPAGDGGGLLMFGSYRDSDNQDRIGAPAKINVEIKNSGRLENTGQVWFGADDEHTAGTQATITINNGVMDLTGGTILQSNSTLEVDADLAFFYDYDETNAVPKNEQWAINFTGPGSLTVDSAGINVYRQDDQSVWTGGAPVSYQDLWNQGILKANGLSGGAVQPADFGTFFSVTGTPGGNNYTLTSLLLGDPQLGLAGDYDGNGQVDGGDFLAWQRTLGQTVAPGAGADGNGNGTIDAGDLTVWRGGFGDKNAAGAIGAVPEPASAIVAAVGLMGLAAVRRRRAA